MFDKNCSQRALIDEIATRFMEMDPASEDSCLNAVTNIRWPGEIAPCAKCGVDRKHYRVSGRTCYVCPVCGSHLFPLAGTIFHKSTTPLTTWFFVIKLMTSTRVGISAKQIQRETGVTYKTAWRMMKVIDERPEDEEEKIITAQGESHVQQLQHS
jgi:transposase-like protein